MKKNSLIFLVMILLLALNPYAYANDTELEPEESVTAKHVFGVHGLSCPFCVIGIKKTFKKIKGVQSIEVSLKHNTVTILTDKGLCFSDEELIKIFSKAGFSYHGTALQPDVCRKHP